MSLTPVDINRLAHLARLGLKSDECAGLCTQLNDFFKIVEKMRAIDTTGVLPLAHPVDAMGEIALRLCDDTVSEFNQLEANQRSAPAVEDGLFLVPQVIE